MGLWVAEIHGDGAVVGCGIQTLKETKFSQGLWGNNRGGERERKRLLVEAHKYDSVLAFFLNFFF
jgi:hypothetical protein